MNMVSNEGHEELKGAGRKGRREPREGKRTRRVREEGKGG